MLVGLYLAIALFIAVLMHLKGQQLSTSLPFLFSQGLGKPQSHSLVGGFLAASGPVNRAWRFGHILFANSFQVLISFLYLFYNNILTCQVAADEFIRFLDKKKGKKALRVSSPKALQRSSFFLSLPWRYGVPQMALFTALHWLVSQSIFVVQTSAYRIAPTMSRVPTTDATRLGFSCVGIFWVVILATSLIATLFGHSYFRKYPTVPADFPRMATNSAAIDVVCRPAQGDTDAHLLPIWLGVVTYGLDYEGEGRVTFSTDKEMKAVDGGVQYELPILRH
jgi:hypothetical protein